MLAPVLPTLGVTAPSGGSGMAPPPGGASSLASSSTLAAPVFGASGRDRKTQIFEQLNFSLFLLTLEPFPTLNKRNSIFQDQHL